MLNSSPQSVVYMRHRIGSAIVRVMACRLFGTKPLPEPMLNYCQLDPYQQTLVKIEWIKIQNFNSQKCIWKCRLPNGDNFLHGGDELSLWLSKQFCAWPVYYHLHLLDLIHVYMYWNGTTEVLGYNGYLKRKVMLSKHVSKYTSTVSNTAEI